MLTWKLAPAIAAGNTVIAKPSELTSVTAWMMCKLLEKAGNWEMGFKGGHAVGFGDVCFVGFGHRRVTDI